MVHYIVNNNLQSHYPIRGMVYGEFLPTHLPLYLQEAHYENVKSRISRVTIHTKYLVDVINLNTNYTHVNLLDSMDWMKDSDVVKQMAKICIACNESTRVCFRSASLDQPFPCLDHQFISSKRIWDDPTAVLDRVGTYASIHVMRFNDERPLLPCTPVEYKRDIVRDVVTLIDMCTPRDKGGMHADFLNDFYKNQSDYYDNYRSRMLHGKAKLMHMIPYFDQMSILLFAGGTGDVIKYVPKMQCTATCMDMCTSLLNVAKSRYPKMKCVEANAETYVAPEPHDVVICSYSLTMIPNWRKALDCMVQSCKVGGYVCVTDFTVTGNNPVRDAIVSTAFAQDGVMLSDRHITTLNAHPNLQKIRVCVDEGDFPLTPGIYRSEYYYGVWKRVE